jgi:hypothetical protein
MYIPGNREGERDSLVWDRSFDPEKRGKRELVSPGAGCHDNVQQVIL